MASVFRKHGKWYVKVKQVDGRWVPQPTTATTKSEAKGLALELERKVERQRLGLEALPSGCTLTFGHLVQWWLETYSKPMSSHSRNESYARRHLMSSVLAMLPVPRVAASDIETFLQSKVGALSPKSINNLRGYIQSIFSCATRAGQFNGPNPVTDVRKHKVPKRKPRFLEAHEALQVLNALAPRWRPLFAAALFTGLRKGELAGLRKSDVRLRARQMMVSRSYNRETTKGGHEDALPIADQLIPFLEHSLSDNKSEYVFPGPDRQMLDEQTELEQVLRRAMARAGLVTHYEHVCRRCKRKGRPHMEKHDDAELRRCSSCGSKCGRAIPQQLQLTICATRRPACCSTPVSTPSRCNASCATRIRGSPQSIRTPRAGLPARRHQQTAPRRHRGSAAREARFRRRGSAWSAGGPQSSGHKSEGRIRLEKPQRNPGLLIGCGGRI